LRHIKIELYYLVMISSQDSDDEFTEDKWLANRTTAKWRQNQRKKLIDSIGSRLCPFKLKNTQPDVYIKICTMLKRHPDYPDRFNDISDIEVRKNAMNKRVPCLEFCTVNDREVDSFSLEACCRKKRCTPEQEQVYKLKVAMRSAILLQTQNFKNGKPAICDICKESFDVLEVDHKSPLTFKVLFKIFLEQEWKKPRPTRFRKSRELRDGAGRPENAPTAAFLEEDREISDAWCTFHENNCDLRLLCKPCHHSVS